MLRTTDRLLVREHLLRRLTSNYPLDETRERQLAPTGLAASGVALDTTNQPTGPYEGPGRFISTDTQILEGTGVRYWRA